VTKKAVRISDIMGQHAQPLGVEVPLDSPVASETRATRKQGRTHTTLYLHSRVLREIRDIANHFDRKPHELLIEGVNMMLAHYGRASVEQLSKE
jgi:hypothetical protein